MIRNVIDRALWQASVWSKYGVRGFGALVALMALSAATVQAGEQWYPLDVDVWTPPFNDLRQREQQAYVPLEKALQEWRIRVFIPHLKDAYWLGVNYGLIDEARRLGVRLSIFAAGGYDQLEVQRRQIEDALADEPDGLIIGAISQDGLNDLVARAAAMEIPVLDLINGISSKKIAARAAVSFWDMGYQAGMYLRRMQEKGGAPLKVAWFPGPSGAGWVDDGNAGFRKAIEGGAIQILETKFGDTGSAVQGQLIEDALDRYPGEINCIAGTAVTAEAAAKILRRRGLADKVAVIAYYYGPGVHRGIRRGTIAAAPSDLTVVQARIAVDVMVRMLEKKDHFKHVAPRVTIVDSQTIRRWDASTTLAPRGFRPIFSVNEQ
ncbi:MAG: TMAO reductase system periplasmic protein TorT [Desulfobacterales bacterium]|jgi:protein TorT